MSRTWKDKHRKTYGAGPVTHSEFRKKQAEARVRFQRVQQNAIRAGIPCPRCFVMDGIQKGMKCSEHGGGVRAAILRKSGNTGDGS